MLGEVEGWEGTLWRWIYSEVWYGCCGGGVKAIVMFSQAEHLLSAGMPVALMQPAIKRRASHGLIRWL